MSAPADLFLRACRKEPVPRPPVWLMRQAGRYLTEYREIRRRVDFMTLCTTPDLAAEVTVQPVDRLGVDAAILFSDLLVPAPAMGLTLSFVPGPVIDPPVRTRAAVDALESYEPEEDLPHVYETIRILRRALDGRVPLIGFGGAPFTLAAYLVEGEGSRAFGHWKRMIFAEPHLADALLDTLVVSQTAYLVAQARAGAQAIQLFDTWAGLLPAADFRRFALDPARRVIQAVRAAGVPVIYFALDAAHAWSAIRDCGADVVGVDWRSSLEDAGAALGSGYALQGNLDPCVLLSDPDTVRRRTREMLETARGAAGYVANLGHGILPDTPVECAAAFVAAVKGWSG